MQNVALSLLLALSLTACQVNVTPTPAPTASPTSSPTATPTATPMPNPSPSPVVLNTDFTLKYKQNALLSGDDSLELTFDALIQDSRCPRDVTCIRAGDVTVRIIAQLNDAAPMPLDLILGAGEAESRATVGRYTVIFRAVSPNYTQSDRPLQPSDYTVTLQVQRT